MAHNRTRQRGVTQLATSLVLAAMGALLGVTGCSADETRDRAERLGELNQAISCNGPGGCPPDSKCGDWECSLATGMCFVKGPAPDGNPCEVFGVGDPAVDLVWVEGRIFFYHETIQIPQEALHDPFK